MISVPCNQKQYYSTSVARNEDFEARYQIIIAFLLSGWYSSVLRTPRHGNENTSIGESAMSILGYVLRTTASKELLLKSP